MFSSVATDFGSWTNEEIGNLRFILKIVFHCILSINHAFSQNLNI